MLSIVLVFLLGFILISKGADIFINSSIKISQKFNISEVIVGATIVSLATNLPEFTVSILASMEGHTTMSLGNALGSIICNTGLVLGLTIFISPFKVDGKIFISKSVLLLLSFLVLLFLSRDMTISKFDAIFLTVLLFLYMYSDYLSIKSDKNISKSSHDKMTFKETIVCIFLFVAGLLMMVVGSRCLVNSGVEIASMIGIPQGIISLTVIALGTSLPELVSSLTAIKKNHHDISLGTVMGSNILNILGVIGLAAIPTDIPVLTQTFKVDFPFIILFLLILILPTLKSHKLHRFQGIIMLILYIIYLTTLYFMYIVN